MRVPLTCAKTISGSRCYTFVVGELVQCCHVDRPSPLDVCEDVGLGVGTCVGYDGVRASFVPYVGYRVEMVGLKLA